MDARAWIANASDADIEGHLSPGGLPMACCRIRVVGEMPSSDPKRATM
jgi:hypothetical protein